MRARPADAEDRLQRQVRDRGASSSSTLGGAGRVDADFDPLSFPVWQAELGRLCEHLRQVDRAEAQDRLGRAPLDHELGRTPRQRRLDAMRLMAERSAAFDGDLGPSSFCLNMHGGTELVAKILQRIIEALEADDPDHTVDLDDLSYDPDSLHELDDGTVIDAAALDAHCLAHIARFKRPKRYVWLAALPKNAYGKVLKTALREQLREPPPDPAG